MASRRETEEEKRERLLVGNAHFKAPALGGESFIGIAQSPSTKCIPYITYFSKQSLDRCEVLLFEFQGQFSCRSQFTFERFMYVVDEEMKQVASSIC